MSDQTTKFLNKLGDTRIDASQRYQWLKGIMMDDGPKSVEAALAVLSALGGEQAESVYREKLGELEEWIASMQNAPLREATFVKTVQIGLVNQALLVLEDGNRAYLPLVDNALKLHCGDKVMVNGKSSAVMAKAPESELQTGETAQYQRRIDNRHVEVSSRDQRMVFMVSQALADQLDSGEVKPGANLVVNSRQLMANYALPPEDALNQFKYLLKLPPPGVLVEKHIGDPPKFIDELTQLLRLEMTDPCVRRRYKLRRCTMKLLSGVSGSGKTLAIHGFWRRMYEVMSEVTGAAIPDLPNRVFTLRLSQVLSMWFGESDKNVDRFFQEVEELADQKFTFNGREFTLPVLAILEEVDGVARARGQDGIYDRVLTTILQRLDSTREELSSKLIVFIGTTNEPGSVDRAFLRRVGGTVEHFGRLGERGFEVVLDKHLTGLPLAAQQEEVVGHLKDWLFGENGHPLLKLTYANSNKPDVRFRKDLLTGSIIDRAVQQACNEAVATKDCAGLSADMLMRAFENQFNTAAGQINEHTAGHHLDLPDGCRVTGVVRVQG